MATDFPIAVSALMLRPLLVLLHVIKCSALSLSVEVMCEAFCTLAAVEREKNTVDYVKRSMEVYFADIPRDVKIGDPPLLYPP